MQAAGVKAPASLVDAILNVCQSGQRSVVALMRWVIAVAFAAIVVAAAAPATSAADTGYEGPSFSGTTNPTGAKRGESVLWFNDGMWWAHMWHSASATFRIHRLDMVMQRWEDTGIVSETRANTHGDSLWDGTKLYIASHRFASDGTAASSGYPSYLYRYSYDAATDRYSLDSGFPVTINDYRTETLVIDKDSTGKLWATWQQDNKIYVNRTTTDDRTWGTPFALPVSGASVTVDDTSAVVSFGNRIGVMWSNQTSSSNAMWFATHVDSQSDTTWEASRTAIQGSGTADDHMNLKTLKEDAQGRVYAAIKTEHNTSSAPLTMLLVRDPVTGDWASHTIARVSDCPNRPIVVLDEENRRVRTYATYPGPPNYSCNSSGGAIYEKTSSVDAVSFEPGRGTPTIVDDDSPYVHNVSSTKQNANSRTGVALLAVNTSTKRYWHTYLPIPAATPTAPAAEFIGTPTSGTAPLTVAFTDTSTGSPTSWDWDFGDGWTSTAQHPSHTYQAAGTYTVSLRATNASGSNTMTKTGYITVAAPPPVPTADFTGSPTSGIGPLTVTFTDTSTGSPTSWSWDFGDGSTSTAQHPSRTYQPGTYTVKLTATNTSGSDTKTRVGYIVVDEPPSFSLSASPSSQSVVRGNSVQYAVSLTAKGGFGGSIDLTVRGPPAGATARFDPATVSPTSSTSAMTVSTTTDAKLGSHTLTIEGTSGSLRDSTAVTLQVKRK